MIVSVDVRSTPAAVTVNVDVLSDPAAVIVMVFSGPDAATVEIRSVLVSVTRPTPLDAGNVVVTVLVRSDPGRYTVVVLIDTLRQVRLVSIPAPIAVGLVVNDGVNVRS